MADEYRLDNKESPAAERAGSTGGALDAAGKSLSEALRISFIILKVIMLVLIIAFLASGFRTVGPDERGLELRFGKIQGVTEGRVLKPGPHWIFPYPVGEMVKIPVEEPVDVPINSFWYHETKEDIIGESSKRPRRVPEKLNPITEGYCLTRSEGRGEAPSGADGRTGGLLEAEWQILYSPTTGIELELTDLKLGAGRARALADADGSDYNIVHSRWVLTYKVDDPEMFFKNVHVKDVKPGEIYFDAMKESVKPLLTSLFEDAVVTTMVNYTIDEILFEKLAQASGDVERLLQQKLDDIECGIEVVQVKLNGTKWPLQVDEAFEKFVSASQNSQTAISNARIDAENTLNAAAGPVAERLFAALHEPTVSEQERDLLWSGVDGAAHRKIAEARTYETKVVEDAKASWEYLRRLLPEYRKRPELVLQNLYLDTIEEVLAKAEKLMIPPGAEWRIWINKDPNVRAKSKEDTETTEGN
jgi:regulator of protease activity HflC (stomatin/prohibitin superfamily)